MGLRLAGRRLSGYPPKNLYSPQWLALPTEVFHSGDFAEGISRHAEPSSIRIIEFPWGGTGGVVRFAA